jgi:choline dehydrogenase-like flavoprotein
MTEHFEVIVVGSGAGGGVVAGELASRGRSVLLIEAGGHHTAAEFERWESRAMAQLWWPMRFAFPRSGEGAPLPMVTGRCVGGTTTINTKVALRASQPELDRWYEATGLVNERGEPFGTGDLAPYYARVEHALGVRERNDWDWRSCVQTAKRGFAALGIDLHPVHGYSDENCMQCGSCLQGCPTNAGKSTLNTYIHREWMRGTLTLRAQTTVRRVVIEGGEATGVELAGPDGEVEVVGADAVVVACGALGSPQLLARSGVENDRVGRNLGFHPAHFVFGLFDEPQDAHMVAPITSHCLDHATVDRGGFVIEAVTVQDPIGFTVALCDEDGPMWGQPLVDAARDYRRWVGLLNMATDDNNGRVITDADGSARYESDFSPVELQRAADATALSRRVLEAAGATRILWSSPASTHVQGTCPMGADPSRSVVDADGQCHGVARLYVGDSSLFPRTLSVNPSLTVMALATRLADHLDANASGQLRGRRQPASAPA